MLYNFKLQDYTECYIHEERWAMNISNCNQVRKHMRKRYNKKIHERFDYDSAKIVGW